METRWTAWLESWEAQQGWHMPEREQRFAVITDSIRVRCGPTPRVIDLGSGPGSLAVRLVRAVPGASVVAVDRDPVLLELGRRALADESRIRFVDHDLGDSALVSLGAGFDAAVSTTALHWLDHESLQRLYRSLAAMLRTGGLFLNGDRHPAEPSEIAELAAAVREARESRAAAETAPERTWEGWWAAVERDPGFAEAAEKRRRLGLEHPHHEHPPSLADHKAALQQAGFRSIGSLWQILDDLVLAAIR